MKIYCTFRFWLVTVFLVFQMCSGEDVTYLSYRCDIPKGMPRWSIFVSKDNTKERRDVHALYRKYHRKGWCEFMTHYAEKGETSFDYGPTNRWHEVTAARIGISEAKTLILQAEMMYDSSHDIRAAAKSAVKIAQEKKDPTLEQRLQSLEDNNAALCPSPCTPQSP